MINLLRAFLVRDDPEYQAFVDKYQARSLGAKVFYLFMHLVPGLLLYLLINVPSVYRFALHTTGLSETMLQGWFLLAIVFLWHLAVPFALSALDRQTHLSGIDRFPQLASVRYKGLLCRNAARVCSGHALYITLFEIPLFPCFRIGSRRFLL